MLKWSGSFSRCAGDAHFNWFDVSWKKRRRIYTMDFSTYCRNGALRRASKENATKHNCGNGSLLVHIVVRHRHYPVAADCRDFGARLETLSRNNCPHSYLAASFIAIIALLCGANFELCKFFFSLRTDMHEEALDCEPDLMILNQPVKYNSFSKNPLT